MLELCRTFSVMSVTWCSGVNSPQLLNFNEFDHTVHTYTYHSSPQLILFAAFNLIIPFGLNILAKHCQASSRNELPAIISNLSARSFTRDFKKKKKHASRSSELWAPTKRFRVQKQFLLLPLRFHDGNILPTRDRFGFCVSLAPAPLSLWVGTTNTARSVHMKVPPNVLMFQTTTSRGRRGKEFFSRFKLRLIYG